MRNDICLSCNKILQNHKIVWVVVYDDDTLAVESIWWNKKKAEKRSKEVENTFVQPYGICK